MTRDLFIDVNLAEMVFSNRDGDLYLQFLNMSDGAEVGTLQCGGVVTFAYHDYADSELPAYVGEVTVEEIGTERACELMKEVGYALELNREYLAQTPLQYVRVEGPLEVYIVCQRVNLRTPE